MAACAMLTYNNVTPESWLTIKKSVQNFGITINTDSGVAEQSGFTVRWKFDPAAQTLSIQCTSSPFLVTCSIINARINDEIEKSLSQHNVAVTHLIPG